MNNRLTVSRPIRYVGQVIGLLLIVGTACAQPGNPQFDFEKQVGFLLPAVNKNDQIIVHEGYTLCFNDAAKEASWVAYPLLPVEITGDTPREGSSFKPDPAVTTGSALPADYVRSGYDRGHLAPAGDFKFSRRMMSETFFMSNMTPQLPAFNRGIWKELETLVRTWGLRDNGLYVVTGPVLGTSQHPLNLPTIGQVNRIRVPAQFYKVILYCHKPDIRMIGFLINNEGSHEPLTSFVVPVRQIEELTGINFFPLIPDELATELETAPPARTIQAWFF